MVFWWTGRGFLSLLTLIGVFGAFGALVTFTLGEEAFDLAPWLSGVGLLIAAAVNWVVGARLNHKPINLFAEHSKARFVYRARNRFLSLPMELWSAPVAVLGLILIIKGVIGA